MFASGEAVRAFFLLLIANSAPWAAHRVLGGRWATPLDFGWVLPDGKRLFGSHKTWRGLVAGAVACMAAAEMLGLSWAMGGGFGVVALLGDALSSAIKRRLALAPGAEVPGLDQLPEALLPLIAFAAALNIGAAEIGAVALGFMILDLSVVRLRHSQPSR
jgi:CDP-2,3-bis-(O-geranylgeranyl)-sn-glycerol synthase